MNKLTSACSYHGIDSSGVLSWTETSRLDGILASLNGDLLLAEAGVSADESQWIRQHRLFSQLICMASAIRLHLPYVNEVEDSKCKCLDSANAIAHLTATNTDWFDQVVYLDPMLGVCPFLTLRNPIHLVRYFR
jgi:hypothetical protein